MAVFESVQAGRATATYGMSSGTLTSFWTPSRHACLPEETLSIDEDALAYWLSRTAPGSVLRVHGPAGVNDPHLTL